MSWPQNEFLKNRKTLQKFDFKGSIPSLNKNTASTRKYLNLKKLEGVSLSLVFYSEHSDKEKIKNLAQTDF